MLKLYILLSLLAILGFAAEHDVGHPNETVTKLDLSNKGLTSLKEYNFSLYPLLEEIDLSNNELEHIKEKTFEKNKKLVKINLSGNKNLKLPRYSTLLISSAEELDLSNCNIKKLSQNVFDGLRSLKVINLSNNPIKKTGLVAAALYVIEPLQKIILPHENLHVLKELCKDFNITIEINDKDVKTIQCNDYLTVHGEEDEDEEDDDDDEDEPDANVPEETKSVEVPVAGNLSLNETGKEEADQNSTVIAPPELTDEKPHLEPRVEVNKTEDNTTVVKELEIPAINNTNTDNPLNASTEASPVLELRVNDTIQSNATNATITKTINASADLNQTEKLITDEPKIMQRANINVNDKETEKVAEVTESSNTGSTILIVLVIAVVVAGLAAFGYKFYKNRTANQASEPVDRELKEIVTNKPREDPIRDITEQEPLMNNHVAKENGETKPNQSQMVSNNLSTGPYQPTTTTFKPIDETSENGK